MDIDQNMMIMVGGALIGIFIIAKLIKKLFTSKSSIALNYIKKGDPQAQALYDDKYRDKNPLTKDQKIEMSWQFLYDITDIVLNKFSPDDRKAIHDIGHNLLDKGTGYEHVIEYGLKQEKKASRLVEEAAKETTKVKEL